MQNYKEKDITDFQYWNNENGYNHNDGLDNKYDHVYRNYREEGGIESDDEEEKKRYKTKWGPAFFLDIILLISVVVLEVFGTIYIKKYGMPVGEDSFYILGFKNVTKFTSNTINEITKLTIKNLGQTFNIKSNTIVNQSIDINYDLNEAFQNRYLLGNYVETNKNNTKTNSKNESKNKNEENNNSTKKKYTFIQFLKEQSLLAIDWAILSIYILVQLIIIGL